MFQAKLGRWLYLSSAGGLWAGGARVARGITGVPTLRSRVKARLLTITFNLALPTMADPFAVVRATGQQFITDQTTRDVLQVAWDITSLLEIKQTRGKERQRQMAGNSYSSFLLRNICIKYYRVGLRTSTAP